MKIRRKSLKCENCNHSLAEFYNYCPVCGQENHSFRIGFWTLAKDFFSNYFALDSKLGKTIKPFFIKPGYLTMQFMQGKRASYANPVRLYLVISLFYFLVLSNIGQRIISESVNEISANSKLSPEEIEALKAEIDQSDLAIIEKALRTNDFEYMPELDSSKQQLLKSSLSKAKLIKLFPATDSAKAATSLLIADSIRSNNTGIIDNQEDLDEENDGLHFFGMDVLKWVDWNELRKQSKDLNYTEKEVFERFARSDMNAFEIRVLQQTIKFIRLGPEVMIGYAIKNLPLMMFFLLPIFAATLALLYWRKKIFYIDHIIHSLHLHSFAYMVYGITLIIVFYFVDNDTINGWLEFGAFMWVSIYTFLSFLKVYQQSKRKTVLKFILQGAFYGSLIMIAVVFELLLSVLIY